MTKMMVCVTGSVLSDFGLGLSGVDEVGFIGRLVVMGLMDWGSLVRQSYGRLVRSLLNILCFFLVRPRLLGCPRAHLADLDLLIFRNTFIRNFLPFLFKFNVVITAKK